MRTSTQSHNQSLLVIEKSSDNTDRYLLSLYNIMHINVYSRFMKTKQHNANTKIALGLIHIQGY